MPITLQKLASPQTIKLPEKKIVSWVRLKDLPVSEEIIPVDGRKKFSALTEFKVWGTEVNNSNVNLPSGESLVNLAKKVNDYWIKTGGNTGNDATNYNHGHSVTSEFWAPSVFYTGNMEAYYLTGDENYTDYASRWGSNNIYNGTAWNTKADTGRIGKYFPDNHTSFQTYLDMFSITSDAGFDANDENDDNSKEDKPKKYRIRGIDIKILNERVQYYDKDGKLITESITDYSKKNILGEYATLDEFINIWNSEQKKQVIIDELQEKGVLLEALREAYGNNDIDDFDLICHIAYDKKPLTKAERANNVKKRGYLYQYSELAQQVLNALLDKYMDKGITDITSIEILLNDPFRQFGTPMKITKLFGGKVGYLNAVKELEKQIYAA